MEEVKEVTGTNEVEENEVTITAGTGKLPDNADVEQIVNDTVKPKKRFKKVKPKRARLHAEKLKRVEDKNKKLFKYSKYYHIINEGGSSLNDLLRIVSELMKNNQEELDKPEWEDTRGELTGLVKTATEQLKFFKTYLDLVVLKDADDKVVLQNVQFNGKNVQGEDVIQTIPMPVIKEGGPDITDTEVIAKYIEIDRWVGEIAVFIIETANPLIRDISIKLEATFQEVEEVQQEESNEDGKQ